MVAITVILAAVIGAFVLEIGDQQETAPSTSFESGQQMKYMAPPGGSANSGNYTQVEFSHAGGDVVDISSVQIAVNGNTSVWNWPSNNPKCGVSYRGCTLPEPNVKRTLGTNKPAEFFSGQTWHFFYWGKYEQGYDGAVADENVKASCTYYVAPGQGDKDEIRMKDPYNCWDGNSVENHANALETGDSTKIVWRASSGGKTQTLFKYTVQ
jgi:hypothetical protein